MNQTYLKLRLEREIRNMKTKRGRDKLRDQEGGKGKRGERKLKI